MIYVLLHADDGDSVGSYQGQSEQTVTDLLTQAGKKFDFITKDEYDAFINDHAGIPDRG